MGFDNEKSLVLMILIMAMETKLLNYCIVIGPGLDVKKISLIKDSPEKAADSKTSFGIHPGSLYIHLPAPVRTLPKNCTRYHQENTIERHRYSSAGWLVWGGIILGSRTDLHVQSVTMADHIYRDVILEKHARLFRGAMGAEVLFMVTTPVVTVQTL
ncbi:HTH_Tnp_Tc3_2 domain-containing protein [Trichonephila clavipes]|nr:HTH_Tnp_Tc3_2 domain-containing protein [Trichonephila clavipes]